MSRMKIAVQRGDIVRVNLDGAKGVEKKNNIHSGNRPCIVVQNDTGNLHSPMTIIVPLNNIRQDKLLPIQVMVSAADLNFLGSKDSVVECGHVRSIDGDARIQARLGQVSIDTMKRIDTALAASLGLSCQNSD